MSSHQEFMQEALNEAKKAQACGEVPVGAIIVKENKIIARAHNLKESNQNPLGHAEIYAILKAAKLLKTWRILNSVIYVTLEPCIMCTGAIINARIPKLIFGCKDPKSGAVVSLYQIGKDHRLNHTLEVTAGVLEKECSLLLQNFFKTLR
jgi:tRNA(adenine34) deaminase